MARSRGVGDARDGSPRRALTDVAKVILLSVLFATFAIPLFFSRERVARRGLRKTVIAFGAFMAFYVFAVLVIYPRLG